MGNRFTPSSYHLLHYAKSPKLDLSAYTGNTQFFMYCFEGGASIIHRIGVWVEETIAAQGDDNGLDLGTQADSNAYWDQLTTDANDGLDGLTAGAMYWFEPDENDVAINTPVILDVEGVNDTGIVEVTVVWGPNKGAQDE